MSESSESVEPGPVEHRVFSVPEGLAGERVDAALARLLSPGT